MNRDSSLKTCEHDGCNETFKPSNRGGKKKSKRFCSTKCKWAQWSEDHPRVKRGDKEIR